MQTPFIGGITYFLTFIDDFTIKTWIYFLKHKFDAFGCFQEFKSFVEKQSGEYVSRYFHNFCKVHGSDNKFTA
jgi:hypothetical protein